MQALEEIDRNQADRRAADSAGCSAPHRLTCPAGPRPRLKGGGPSHGVHQLRRPRPWGDMGFDGLLQCHQNWHQPSALTKRLQCLADD